MWLNWTAGRKRGERRTTPRELLYLRSEHKKKEEFSKRNKTKDSKSIERKQLPVWQRIWEYGRKWGTQSLQRVVMQRKHREEPIVADRRLILLLPQRISRPGSQYIWYASYQTQQQLSSLGHKKPVIPTKCFFMASRHHVLRSRNL